MCVCVCVCVLNDDLCICVCVQRFQLFRALCHDSRRHKPSQTRKCGETMLLLGQVCMLTPPLHYLIVLTSCRQTELCSYCSRLMLDLANIMSMLSSMFLPHAYIHTFSLSSLRACLAATIRSSGVSQSTIKLVATNLIASSHLMGGYLFTQLSHHCAVYPHFRRSSVAVSH